jgi:hypothetical protein
MPISGICWWCYWGWPKPIADIYDDCLAKLDGWKEPLEFGPGHVVWSDENWDSAQWCLEHFGDYPKPEYMTDDHLAIVRESLERLCALPDEYKHEPDEYEGSNPEDYPPPSHWEMIRR